MGVFDFLGGAIKPITDLVDSLHTSGEEKEQLRAEFARVENLFAERVLEYEQKILQMKTDIITAEAKGESWLQRSWRPLTMLTFLVLVVFDSFGWLINPLAPEAWTLLQLGIGGYVVGRTAEKVVPAVVDKFKKE